MQYDAINAAAAARLGVPALWLRALIAFESGWRPLIKNPLSSARGLIQFTDATARDLGYRDSLDLVTKHPTIDSQMPVVIRYLEKYRPFPTEQSLYMAVFRPADRYSPPDKQFPASVQRVNPGIKTPGDYMAFVRRRMSGVIRVAGAGGALLLLTLAALAFFFRGGK